MATINFLTYGNLGLSGISANCNVAQVQCITSTNTWSVISPHTAAVISNIDTMCAAMDSSYYVGINSTIYKCNNDFILDTTWGTAGAAYITSNIGSTYPYWPKIVANTFGYCCAIRDLDAAGSAVNCWAFNSAGISTWAKSTITTQYSPITIVALPNGNFVLGGSVGTVVGLREYNYTNGTYVRNYPAISMAYHYGLCVNTVGEIFTGGYDTSGAGVTRIYKFLPTITAASWSFTTAYNWVMAAAANSAYVFVNDYPSDYILNKSTGTVVAEAAIGGGYSFHFIALATVPNIWITHDVSGLKTSIIDETGTTLAQAANAVLSSLGWKGLIGYSATGGAGFNVQAPRVTTYQRKLLAFANDEVWAEVTA